VAWPFARSSIVARGVAIWDLDNWVCEYNEEREQSGRYCFGKTSIQTFLDSTYLAREKMLDGLMVGDVSDTAGLRAAPEQCPQERSAGRAPHCRITSASVR
jgi:hypothetical protein